MSAIVAIFAREILDSRGIPTVEVEISTTSHCLGRASVPSGASTGQHEAFELRDQDHNRYLGHGVKKVISNIEEKIVPKMLGIDVCEQALIDQILVELDGTYNKRVLGANATLAVSLACARAGAEVTGQSLFRYLGGVAANRLPVPMMNFINGGAHANNNIDFQEFMIVPHGAKSFSEALRWGSEVFHTLKAILKRSQRSIAVGDEGGFAPNLESNEEAISLIVEAISAAGYSPGKDISLALDVAASELYQDGVYTLKGEKLQFDNEQLIGYLDQLVAKYPIISVEDGLDQNDWDGYAQLTQKLGANIQVVGDDIFVTTTSRLVRAVKSGVANAILVKPNQIGTLSETLQCIAYAQNQDYGVIISHRSGDTEDTFIADLAVATNSGQIKTGSLSRTDRICKYNQLLRIEEELGNAAWYGL